MILVDTAEPEEIIPLIQQAVPVTRVNLNSAHMADYMFYSVAGKKLQFSRKQTGEIMNDLDEAEDQLKDYYNNADESYQIVEGLLSPVKLSGYEVESRYTIPTIREFAGTMYSWKVEANGFVHSGIPHHGVTPAMWYAWIHRVACAGIATYFTVSQFETAKLLVALYRNEQKPPEQHSTFNRIIKPKMQMREEPDFVKALVFVGNAYKIPIGENRAKAIAEKYHSFFHLAMASVNDVANCKGVGQSVASRLLKAIGAT